MEPGQMATEPFFTLLPSATKLRRLCFYRRVSVDRGGLVWSRGGVPAPRGLSALGEVAAPRGDLLQGVSAPRGGVCSGGCLLSGGVCSRGSAPGGVCTEAGPPWERRLLLRTVRILLECILVWSACVVISFCHILIVSVSSLA